MRQDPADAGKFFADVEDLPNGRTVLKAPQPGGWIRAESWLFASLESMR